MLDASATTAKPLWPAHSVSIAGHRVLFWTAALITGFAFFTADFELLINPEGPFEPGRRRIGAVEQSENVISRGLAYSSLMCLGVWAIVSGPERRTRLAEF